MNRLKNEDSPYLRQHAENPVDWYPWGDEALAKAKADNKPIFLSVGYSTCHWCHVMERESFENRKVAEILNRHFVPIKVDRESRPDIDEIYMLATQALTGRGGWPNSVFLTPSGEPFYAGTYYPRDTFLRVLDAVVQEWTGNQKAIEENAKQIAGFIREHHARRRKAAEMTPAVFSGAIKSLLTTFDDLQGGFSQAPKFPQEPIIAYLLHRAERENSEEALEAAEFTLNAMQLGGIHDQVGGGFHRYSTDNEWLVPHFEKMLYNQAQLAPLYAKAFTLTGNANLARAARRALDYVREDLTGPDGGFYSARDADSEGEEGVFYVWKKGQIAKVLGAEDAELFIRVFGITESGNFEGANIPHLEQDLSKTALDKNEKGAPFITRVDRMLKKLEAARARREQPHRDEKILVSWNGMMINGFAIAGDRLDDTVYITAAEKAAEMIWSTMLRDDGTFWRVMFEGRMGTDGQQEDYAWYALGMTRLYDVTGNRKWLERAQKTADTMVRLFLDKEAGDFYLTEGKAALFSRLKMKHDGATASGNSVALDVLSRLSRRTGKPEYERLAEGALAAMSGGAAASPSGHAYGLMAADQFLNGESGPRAFLGKGALKVEAGWTDDQIKVKLKLAKGWHVNANQLLEKDLIPTVLTISQDGGQNLGEISYPPPIMRKLGFSDSELALYEGEAEIMVGQGKPPKDEGNGRVILKLDTQICSDEICLEPESVTLQLPHRKV